MNHWRRYLSELFGTAALLCAVIGSGIMAEQLADGNTAVALLANTFATVFALYVLIETLGPISGAHFNPVVTGISYFRRELTFNLSMGYIVAQIIGAITGTIFANLIFNNSAIDISTKSRDGGNLLLSEFFATAGLIFVIYQLSTIERSRFVSVGVASWIFAAYFFTSSTSFANPAIAIGRIFSNSFAGIAPHSALAFIPFEILGAACGYLLFTTLNQKVKK